MRSSDKVQLLPEKEPDDPVEYAKWLSVQMIASDIESAFAIGGHKLAINAAISAIYSYIVFHSKEENFARVKTEASRCLRATADMIEISDGMGVLVESSKKPERQN